jgi:hypothetical protein
MFPFGSFLTQIPLIILAALYLAYAGAFLVRKYDGAANLSEEKTTAVSERAVNCYPLYSEIQKEEQALVAIQLLFPAPENEDLPLPPLCLRQTACHYTEFVLSSQPPPALF